MASTVTSWATWGLVITALIGALQAIAPLVSPAVGGIITAVVAIMAAVLHNNQVKTTGIKS